MSIIQDKLYKFILDKGLDILILAVEKSEAQTVEYLRKILTDFDFAWLPDDVEGPIDEAIVAAGPKLFQMIVDGLKLLKVAQITTLK